MPTGSQSYDCSLSRHSPYTFRMTYVLLRASSHRPYVSCPCMDSKLRAHSPYTSKSTSCRLRASSTRLDVDLSVHGLKASRKIFVDGTVLLCYCISKVAKGLFFLREKSGCMACRRQELSGCEATAPGSDGTAARAGIKQTAHIVGGSACVQGLHYHALSASREIITQQRTRRHTLSVSR
jgi:hypothetical protein